MAPQNALQLLVPTKLMPPRAQSTWVPRARLLRALDAASAASLILVVAPMGFGKSTLVAQWLQGAGRGPAAATDCHQPTAAAWLTLDEHDQDGLRFLSYLAGAIEQALPGALPLTVPLLRATQAPLAIAVLQALLVDLSALPGGVTLVLDDYHQVADRAVHQLTGYLLRNLPPGCRLVVLSRADPPLPLARLRAEGRLREVRAADLRFSEAEAERLLAGLLGADPRAELVAALHRQTEGWAIALQLAALALPAEAAATAARPPVSAQIPEHLADEVFNRQPPEVQTALMALAVPERFCARLCAALVGIDELRAEVLLEQLARANLFLTALDDAGGWYRFHLLFRDLLLRRLRLAEQRSDVRGLQRRAARWLEAEGLFEEAIYLLLEAGDEDAAGALVEQVLHRDLGRATSSAPPRSWMALLPERLIARRPGLALIEARIGAFHMDLAGCAAGLARVDALLAAPGAAGSPHPWPSFPGDLATQRGMLRYWQGRPVEAIALIRAGLEQGTVPALATSGLLFLGRAYVADGRYEEGVALIQALPDSAPGPALQATEMMRATALCMTHELAGEVDAFAREAGRLVEGLHEGQVRSSWATFAESYLGRATYEQSNLEVAARCFTAVRRRRYDTNAYNYIGSLGALAVIAALQGDGDAAAAYEQEVWDFAAEIGAPYLHHEAIGCSVSLALSRGDIAAALDGAERNTLDGQLGTRPWYAIAPPQLSQARALIAAAGAARLARAEALVAPVLAEAEALHNLRPLVCALAVQAVLRQAQGRHDEAQAAMERALRLAAPRGVVRTLADLGPEALELARDLAAWGVEPAYVRRLLAAATPRVGPGAPRPPTTLQPALLTQRELEILKLLAVRLSDKEIAERLVIAPTTVRKHTSSIYGKLGVSSRRAAVTVAQGLGILPQAPHR